MTSLLSINDNLSLIIFSGALYTLFFLSTKIRIFAASFGGAIDDCTYCKAFGFCAAGRGIKRESGANPEQTRCCKLQQKAKAKSHCKINFCGKVSKAVTSQKTCQCTDNQARFRGIERTDDRRQRTLCVWGCVRAYTNFWLFDFRRAAIFLRLLLPMPKVGFLP